MTTDVPRPRHEAIAPASAPMQTQCFTDAFAFAATAHATQMRKGTRIPYVSHLMAVASLTLEYGGDENLAIAALLHDAAEDQGGRPMPDRIRERFGDRVADIVAGRTDTFEGPKPPSAERKPCVIDVQPPSGGAWERFTHELAESVNALDEDEFLIVSIKHTNRFVQFVGQGSFGLRAEVSSNFYLPEEEQLSADQAAALVAMGWNAPTNLPDELEFGGSRSDESPNHFLDAAYPVPYEEIARLAVATLCTVFGAGHPGRLQYEAMGEKDVSIRFPNLRIRRRRA